MLEGQDLGMKMLELQLHFTALIRTLADGWLHGWSHCPTPAPQAIRKASTAQPECWYPHSHAGYGHGHVTKSMPLSVHDRCWSGLLTVNYMPSRSRLGHTADIWNFSISGTCVQSHDKLMQSLWEQQWQGTASGQMNYAILVGWAWLPHWGIRISPLYKAIFPMYII